MYSKVKVLGHPIHPMLIPYPISLYTLTLLGFILYQYLDDPFWFRFGYAANIGAIIMAVIAAIPGFIDWLGGIPSNTRAKRDGAIHMLLNVTVLVVFAINAWINSGQWNLARPDPRWAITLSAIGLVLTVFAGFFGWKLVQTHHVGVQLTPEQERLETTAGATYQGR